MELCASCEKKRVPPSCRPQVTSSAQVVCSPFVKLPFLKGSRCSAFQDILAKYMTDRLRDVELRIFAYLYYMRCPMENKLLRIITMLQNESSQQVCFNSLC